LIKNSSTKKLNINSSQQSLVELINHINSILDFFERIIEENMHKYTTILYYYNTNRC